MGIVYMLTVFTLNNVPVYICGLRAFTAASGRLHQYMPVHKTARSTQ